MDAFLNVLHGGKRSTEPSGDVAPRLPNDATLYDIDRVLDTVHDVEDDDDTLSFEDDTNYQTDGESTMFTRDRTYDMSLGYNSLPTNASCSSGYLSDRDSPLDEEHPADHKPMKKAEKESERLNPNDHKDSTKQMKMQDEKPEKSNPSGCLESSGQSGDRNEAPAIQTIESHPTFVSECGQEVELASTHSSFMTKASCNDSSMSSGQRPLTKEKTTKNNPKPNRMVVRLEGRRKKLLPTTAPEEGTGGESSSSISESRGSDNSDKATSSKSSGDTTIEKLAVDTEQQENDAMASPNIKSPRNKSIRVKSPIASAAKLFKKSSGQQTPEALNKKSRQHPSTGGGIMRSPKYNTIKGRLRGVLAPRGGGAGLQIIDPLSQQQQRGNSGGKKDAAASPVKLGDAARMDDYIASRAMMNKKKSLSSSESPYPGSTGYSKQATKPNISSTESNSVSPSIPSYGNTTCMIDNAAEELASIDGTTDDDDDDDCDEETAISHTPTDAESAVTGEHDVESCGSISCDEKRLLGSKYKGPSHFVDPQDEQARTNMARSGAASSKNALLWEPLLGCAAAADDSTNAMKVATTLANMCCHETSVDGISVDENTLVEKSESDEEESVRDFPVQAPYSPKMEKKKVSSPTNEKQIDTKIETEDASCQEEQFETTQHDDSVIIPAEEENTKSPSRKFALRLPRMIGKKSWRKDRAINTFDEEVLMAEVLNEIQQEREKQKLEQQVPGDVGGGFPSVTNDGGTDSLLADDSVDDSLPQGFSDLIAGAIAEEAVLSCFD